MLRIRPATSRWTPSPNIPKLCYSPGYEGMAYSICVIPSERVQAAKNRNKSIERRGISLTRQGLPEELHW